jgi:hypothetical protein
MAEFGQASRIRHLWGRDKAKARQLTGRGYVSDGATEIHVRVIEFRTRFVRMATACNDCCPLSSFAANVKANV